MLLQPFPTSGGGYTAMYRKDGPAQHGWYSHGCGVGPPVNIQLDVAVAGELS